MRRAASAARPDAWPPVNRPDGLFLKIREDVGRDDVADTKDLCDGVVVDVDHDGEIVGIMILPPAFERIRWMGGSP